MSKNAEGWIRHRGGKCPVDPETIVEVRLRDGTCWVDSEAEAGSFWTWQHSDICADIMAYRLRKPAEQVAPDIYAADDSEQMGGVDISFIEPAIAQGPLQWRDRIAEIDATTQALTTDRAELVQKLASEGFALIGRVVEPVEDMSDWRNWKEGDRIEVISKGLDGRDIGEMLTVDGLDDNDSDQPVGVTGDDKTRSWPIVSDGHFLCIKWHSRPSA